ncbi:hypothetical protein [Clostridium beijerinckii]|nr:hypothetical protein [Clostridium beijerinckii]
MKLSNFRYFTSFYGFFYSLVIYDKSKSVDIMPIECADGKKNDSEG